MATAKLLQSPQILGINKASIIIAHPDISQYIRTQVASPISAAGVTLSVYDNHGFIDDDWFVIGEVGDEKTEEGDVNGAVTRGTTLTITNTNKFDHELNAPVTRILERKIKIYGAATDGGVGTVIASTSSGVNIKWNDQYTEIIFITTDTSYNYYYATFYDGTTESAASDYVAASGLSDTSALEMAKRGLDHVNAFIDGKMITYPWLLGVINDFQDQVTNYIMPDGGTKDWTWELAEDDTSLALTQSNHKYALSSLSFTPKYAKNLQGIYSVKLGKNMLDYVDFEQIETDYNGVAQTTLSAQATAASVSVTLTDSTEFTESGSVWIGSDLVTYTANDQTTGVLSGIPAAGSGSITTTQAAGSLVWQGVSLGIADKYSVLNGYIYLNKPAQNSVVGQKLKVKGYKKISRLTSLSQETTVPFAYLALYYVGFRVESKKRNLENAQKLMQDFKQALLTEAQRDKSNVEEEFVYYKFLT